MGLTCVNKDLNMAVIYLSNSKFDMFEIKKKCIEPFYKLVFGHTNVVTKLSIERQHFFQG